MQIDHFLSELSKFHDEFECDISPAGRAEKLHEEIMEYLLEECGNDRYAKVDEATDMLVCVIAYLISEGVSDPLYAAWAKLCKTAVKYRLAAL